MQTSCSCCQKPKAQLKCEACENPMCKSCAEFLEEGFFSYLEKIPAILQKTSFCLHCYNEHIAAEVQSYLSDLEQSKELMVFERTQGKETRLIKRNEQPTVVRDCLDRQEVMMKLAFRAYRRGFNGLLDFEATSIKSKDGSYSLVTWQGSAVPAMIDSKKLLKDKALRDNPN